MLGYLQLINKGESMNTSKSTIEVYSNGYLEQLKLIKEEIFGLRSKYENRI